MSDKTGKTLDNELANIQKDYKQNKKEVIDFLINSVLSVKTEIPANCKPFIKKD